MLVIGRLSAALFLGAFAGCAAPHHQPDARWLEPRTLRASVPLRPAPADRPVRVAVYGDVQGNREVHAAVIAAIRAEKPDLVIFLGDAMDCLPTGWMPDLGPATYAVPFWPQEQRGFPAFRLMSLVPFPALLDEFVFGPTMHPPRTPDSLDHFLEDSAPLRLDDGVPFAFVPGNHDLYHRPDREAVADVFGSPDGLEGRDSGALWHSFDLGMYRFVVLDSGTDVHLDRDPLAPGGAQERWFHAALRNAWDRGLAPVVCLHCPPRASAGAEPPLPSARRFIEGARALRDENGKRLGGIPLVLSGHAHVYERLEETDADGFATTYVVSGGAGGPFHGKRGPSDPASRACFERVRHFVMLELDASGIRGRLVPAGGEAETDAFAAPLR
jgi:3',5'-cyclic AMP phosphodiesterase CpdA